jgi:hypothetical protein
MIQELRVLIATHGYEKVHAGLQECMRQDYEFLTRMFAPVEAQAQAQPQVQPQAQLQAQVQPQPQVQPQAEPDQQSEPLTAAKVKNMKVTVKKAVVEVPPVPIQVVPVPVQEQEQQSQPDPSKFRSPAEVKEFQRQAVEKKHLELEAQGISSVSILTKENLKKWIEEEGNTYAWVAREKAGCSEEEVSAIAKSFGILSRASKKRGMLIAQKKKQQQSSS